MADDPIRRSWHGCFRFLRSDRGNWCEFVISCHDMETNYGSENKGRMNGPVCEESLVFYLFMARSRTAMIVSLPALDEDHAHAKRAGI